MRVKVYVPAQVVIERLTELEAEDSKELERVTEDLEKLTAPEGSPKRSLIHNPNADMEIFQLASVKEALERNLKALVHQRKYLESTSKDVEISFEQ